MYSSVLYLINIKKTKTTKNILFILIYFLQRLHFRSSFLHVLSFSFRVFFRIFFIFVYVFIY